MNQKHDLLLHAIVYDNTEKALEYLMDSNLIAYLMEQPDIGDPKIIFVFECTACRGNVPILNRLLAIPNIDWLVTYSRNRMLCLAALNNRPQMVKRLLEIPEVILEMYKCGTQSEPLHTATKRGDLAMIHMLIQKLGISEHKMAHGMSALKEVLHPRTYRPEVAYILAQWLWPKGQKQMWADKEILALDSDLKQNLLLMPKKIIDRRIALLATYNCFKTTKSKAIRFIDLPLGIWQQYILPFLYKDEKAYEGKNTFDDFSKLPAEKRVFFMYGIKSEDHFELINNESIQERTTVGRSLNNHCHA